MNKINLGVAKSIITRKAQNEFLDNTTLNESAKPIYGFVNLLENSDILRNEYVIFKNLENKHIVNEFFASRYIDENIDFFSRYKYSDIIAEHKKIEAFIGEDEINDISESQLKLYDAINSLLLEKSKSADELPDIDKLHESFLIICEHIQNNEQVDNDDSEALHEYEEYFDDKYILENAVQIFNNRYTNLDENEIKHVKIIASGKEKKIKNLYESLKSDNMNILKNIEENELKDFASQTIEKLNEMKYDNNTIVEDITSLYELKKNLA